MRLGERVGRGADLVAPPAELRGRVRGAPHRPGHLHEPVGQEQDAHEEAEGVGQGHAEARDGARGDAAGEQERQERQEPEPARRAVEHEVGPEARPQAAPQRELGGLNDARVEGVHDPGEGEGEPVERGPRGA